MASPLGEMFDHGTCQISLLDMLVRGIYRLRCHQHDSEIASTENFDNVPKFTFVHSLRSSLLLELLTWDDHGGPSLLRL